MASVRHVASDVAVESTSRILSNWKAEDKADIALYESGTTKGNWNKGMKR